MVYELFCGAMCTSSVAKIFTLRDLNASEYSVLENLWFHELFPGHFVQPPVPKPRTVPATATAAATPGQQVPNNAHLPYPTGLAPHPNPSPMMTGAAPQPPARPSVQAR